MELVFATNNAHKLSEVQAILGDHVVLRSLSDIGFSGDLPETSGTIPGNALQKAEALYALTGRDCFADDSGLEIAALVGRPGVDSAHYSGQRDSVANMDKVLREMKDASDRSARFVTVIVLVIGGVSHLFEGEVHGKILRERAGTGGFGYDPIFVPEGYDRSFAALAPEEKNRISHRAEALRKMVGFLK